MLQRPGELRVDIEIEHAIAPDRGYLTDVEAIKAIQPVGLIKPVFTHERRLDERQVLRRIRNGAEGRIINAPQTVAAIKPGAGGENGAIVCAIGPHDHLRALTGRRKAPGLACPDGRLPRLLDLQTDIGHGAANIGGLLFRRETANAAIGRQFDIDRKTIRIKPRLLDQPGRRFGNGFQVDIAAKTMGNAQFTRHAHHLFHRVIGGADDAGGQEQPLDIVAPIKLQRQPNHFFWRKPRSLDIAGRAVDAIGAIIDAEIGQQNFQERNAAPVRRIGMADARPFRGAQTA
ncbi:hypothetical protein D3C78_1198830 [compost metagenome]